MHAGRNALIAAPTGSGKTFAAFLAAIDSLLRQGLEGTLRDETQVVYVSPLKALSNDVQKNLAEPLAEIRRSEEHTSELQSPCNLVCRLLLEKKKNKTCNEHSERTTQDSLP